MLLIKLQLFISPSFTYKAMPLMPLKLQFFIKKFSKRIKPVLPSSRILLFKKLQSINAI